MPHLKDVNTKAISRDDLNKKIESMERQLNEWGRLISNEQIVKIIKSDLTTESIKIGKLSEGSYGLSFSDGDVTLLTITKDGLLLSDGTNDRMIIGKDEDGF